MTVPLATGSGCKEPQHRFPGDRPDCEQQQHGVEQRREDRRAAQAIGVTRRRRAPGRDACNPGNSEPQNIGEVVPGVGDERHGIGQHAVAELHRDERQVEADADREGHAEACGSVDMGAPVLVMISVFMHVIATMGTICAHWEHEDERGAAGTYAPAPLLHQRERRSTESLDFNRRKAL